MNVWNLLYTTKFTLISAAPIVFLSWLFSKKKVHWHWYEFTLLIVSPIIWQLLLYIAPVGKSLSNVFAELLFLGFGLGLIFVASIFISFWKQKAKLPFLIIFSLLLPFFVYWITPLLSE